MFGISRSGFAFALLLFVTPVMVAQGAIIVPEDHVAALAGVIKLVHGYGPPGYGANKKTDRRITYWVLDVPTAVNTPCKPDRPEWRSIQCASTKRLRLFFPTLPLNNGLELAAKKLEGHRVVVSGVVHRADTLGEITPIYMNVTALQPVQALSLIHI